ncbi:MAG: thiol-disulfide isomerase/thioredoxin [Candidatus Paceibacteria bacterium]|jgi:thiol-disulfide isomerase/thioredoxin
MIRFLLPVCVALGLVACSGESVSPPANEVLAVHQPSIQIVDFDGLEKALAARVGQGYLLNFWAMWCAPCVAELPELLEVADEYRDRGGDVIGISYDLMVADSDSANIEANIEKFLERKQLDLTVLILDDPDYERINERYDLPGEVPVTLAIDKTGAIVDKHHGKAGKQRFEELMKKALGL